MNSAALTCKSWRVLIRDLERKFQSRLFRYYVVTLKTHLVEINNMLLPPEKQITKIPQTLLDQMKNFSCELSESKTETGFELKALLLCKKFHLINILSQVDKTIINCIYFWCPTIGPSPYHTPLFFHTLLRESRGPVDESEFLPPHP